MLFCTDGTAWGSSTFSLIVTKALAVEASEKLRNVFSGSTLSKDTQVDFLQWWFGHDDEDLLCLFLGGMCGTSGCRSDIRKFSESVEREFQWKVFQNGS